MSEKNVEKIDCADFKALPGSGVEGVIDGKRCFAGNEKMMSERGIALDEVKDKVADEQEQGLT